MAILPLWTSPDPNGSLLACNAPPFAFANEREANPQSRGRRTAGKKEDLGATGTRVLLVGKLRELALYRAEVLRAHGYRVLTPRSLDEARNDIRRGQFDVAVLSYTLSSDAVEELTQLIREYRPEARLIAIADSRTQDRRIRPDQTILADDGPAALIEALRSVPRRT
jgi:CheY-like chemotaxis protein